MSLKRQREAALWNTGGICPGDIAFDIDGVVADTFRVFVNEARKQYGCEFHYEQITDYDFLNVLDIEKDVSDRIIAQLLDRPIESGIRPLEGAVEVLTRLSAAAPLLFVTARPEQEAIGRWLRGQLPGVDPNRIRLEATTTHQRKLPVLLENRVRYFVEDRLETCYFLEEAHIRPIVFRQPWNDRPHPFLSVRDWRELSRLIAW
ncbi:MAG: haloacid dehalogenase [Deltaproteobacteria bacterium]|nr:haloacid dehalogenase [Deltaproteobacteria bacterium]